MNIQAQKKLKSKPRPVVYNLFNRGHANKSTVQYIDNRSEAVAQRKRALEIKTSPRQKVNRLFYRKIGGKESYLKRGIDSAKGTVQLYSEEAHNFSVSTNRQFAVQNEGRDGKLFVLNGTNFPDLQHVDLSTASNQLVNGTPMVEVVADFENEPAMNEMYCGKFSKSVTGITETEENENAPVGRSLYTNKVTSDSEDVTGGWRNHFAPVILTDGGDRATVETAVGVPYWWFGIYGSARGQTFRFKTQYANIIRSLMNEWVDEDTGRRILEELTKYKNDDIENDEELHEYTLQEVIKLGAISEAGPVVLSDKTAVLTENPLTKLESNQKTARDMRAREIQERNSLILKGFLGLGAAALTIIAGYYWMKNS